jgi:hypothetical protein
MRFRALRQRLCFYIYHFDDFCQSVPGGTRDKRIEIFILLFWAHFRREAPETGLSAPIFFTAARQKSISASIPCAFRGAGLFLPIK